MRVYATQRTTKWAKNEKRKTKLFLIFWTIFIVTITTCIHVPAHAHTSAHHMKSYIARCSWCDSFLLFDYSWSEICVCDHQNKGHKRTFTWANQHQHEGWRWWRCWRRWWLRMCDLFLLPLKISLRNSNRKYSDSRKTANDIRTKPFCLADQRGCCRNTLFYFSHSFWSDNLFAFFNGIELCSIQFIYMRTWIKERWKYGGKKAMKWHVMFAHLFKNSKLLTHS